MNLIRQPKESDLPQSLVRHKHSAISRANAHIVLDNNNKSNKKTGSATRSSPHVHRSQYSRMKKALQISSGPVDVDEAMDNEKVLLVEIEEVLKQQQTSCDGHQQKRGSYSSISSCSLTSITTDSSDDDSSKRSRRVVISDNVQYIQPAKGDSAVDRKALWWTRKDREDALSAMRNEARVLITKPKYRNAVTTVLLHCKALSEVNERECLDEDHSVLGSTIVFDETPTQVAEAVLYLVDPELRGLERACLQRLKLRMPGRPCYYWRCSPVRAKSSVLQLQDRLEPISDLSDQEKGCLLSVQYQPYGFYASCWSRLLAEGDAAAMERQYRRLSL